MIYYVRLLRKPGVWDKTVYLVFVVTGQNGETDSVPWAVDSDECSFQVGSELGPENPVNAGTKSRPDAVLLDLDSLSDEKALRTATRCNELGLPVLAVLAAQRLASYDPSLNVKDFILQPFRHGELLLCLNRANVRSWDFNSNHSLVVGDLSVDTERYELRLAGRRVVLTYKEYQLLVLLASNPGKVFTRDGLLSQVWGYDFFGGTRTVDVHIRRLRAKIEDARHSLIETIRNVGYRFNAHR